MCVCVCVCVGASVCKECSSHSILQPSQSIELGYENVSCHSHHGAEQGTHWSSLETDEHMNT